MNPRNMKCENGKKQDCQFRHTFGVINQYVYLNATLMVK